ncbi:MAG TPA: MarC family protein [Nitrospiria bacterium]
MSDVIKSMALILILLNPFLVIVYLVDMVEKLPRKRFIRVMIRAAVIASIVFFCFAILGDFIFSDMVQAEFGSFQIFGGVVFLIIGLQFVFQGPKAITMLRGESQFLAGAIAMPVMIGPGTISASVIIGKRHDPLLACMIILGAVLTFMVITIALKELHDYVRPRNEPLIQRYIEITGRVVALFVGTVAVEMIMQGIRAWSGKF